jgi:hypothetical protein
MYLTLFSGYRLTEGNRSPPKPRQKPLRIAGFASRWCKIIITVPTLCEVAHTRTPSRVLILPQTSATTFPSPSQLVVAAYLLLALGFPTYQFL